MSQQNAPLSPFRRKKKMLAVVQRDDSNSDVAVNNIGDQVEKNIR